MYAILEHALLALLTAFFAAVLIGAVPRLVRRRRKAKQKKDVAPQTLAAMGGILLLIAVALATLLWGRGSFAFSLTALLACALFGMIGFGDDFTRFVRKKDAGLRLWQKLTAQAVLALGFAIALYRMDGVGSILWMGEVQSGFLYIPLAMLVFLASVNGTALADGTEGLAVSVATVHALTVTVLLCVSVLTAPNGTDPARLLQRDSLAAFTAALAGGCLGLLLCGVLSARILPGKTGAYALGGALAAAALLSRTTLLLPLMGIYWIVSAGSALAQGISVRIGQKPLLAASPLHRHLEKRGIPAAKVVTGYSVVTLICSAVALLLYWWIH